MAMPITTRDEDVDRYGGDDDHWSHVMTSLFEKAIESAGFTPIKPVAQGSHLIHGLIIKHLSTADLVVVDLSSHNPNVFFELGVRTSLNLPIALVRDEQTSLPFDTSGINTHTYDSSLRGWEIEAQQESLAQHIRDSHDSCGGQNPLWRQFGLTIRATEPDANESPLEAKVDLLTQQLVSMQDRLEYERANAREEALRAVASASWSDLQARDPKRSAPVDLFAGALHRLLPSAANFRVTPISHTEALVEVDGSVPSSLISRILELANRYEVQAEVGYRIDDSMRAEASDHHSQVGRTNRDGHTQAELNARKRARDRAPNRPSIDPGSRDGGDPPGRDG
jgi:hypothetical protein